MLYFFCDKKYVTISEFVSYNNIVSDEHVFLININNVTKNITVKIYTQKKDDIPETNCLYKAVVKKGDMNYDVVKRCIIIFFESMLKLSKNTKKELKR